MNRNTLKSVSSLVSEKPPFRLLVVEDDDRDAHLIARAVRAQERNTDLHRASTLAEARLLLSELAFEAALVSHELPDGDSFDLLGFMGRQAIRLPVVVLTGCGREDLGTAALRAGAVDFIRKEADQRHLKALPDRLQEAVRRHHAAQHAEDRMPQPEQNRLSETLRSTVAAVKHEINNPLAIISGNAQLLLELARVLQFDDELIKPIRDIEEASLRISRSLDKLSALREIIARECVHTNGHRLGLKND